MMIFGERWRIKTKGEVGHETLGFVLYLEQSYLFGDSERIVGPQRQVVQIRQGKSQKAETCEPMGVESGE